MAHVLGPKPPPLGAGVAVVALFVVVETLLVDTLAPIAAGSALATVYLPGVLVVSTLWGWWLGAVTAAAGAAVFNVIHVLPAADRAELDKLGMIGMTGQHWLAFTVLLAVALVASRVADVARTRGAEAVACCRDAALTADLAEVMLHPADVPSVLPEAARRVAQAFELPSAAIEVEAVASDEHRVAIPLHRGTTQGALVVRADLAEPKLRRLRDRIGPALAILLHAARNCDATRRCLTANADALRACAEEQAALRRVATLVAHGVARDDVFTAVAVEATRLLNADATRVMRYEPGAVATVVAESSHPPQGSLVGKRLVVDSGVTEMVFGTGRAARVDDYECRPGSIAALVRELGLRSSVGAPIVVEGRLWGIVLTSTADPEPPPPDAEERLAQFTELVAVAIADANSRAELKASLARIVIAADDARRRIERDLHDGAQQRVVSLGLQLRAAEAAVPLELTGLKTQLSDVIHGLTDVFANLQDVSRGIHPAILSQGGLAPALKTLGRRCPVPVGVHVAIDQRLPQRVEVAAYYIVCEALTNTAKHANASVVHVEAASDAGVLRLAIRDDGIGGADAGQGSGLTGLNDRVNALGGRMTIASPAGSGTSLLVELPLGTAEPAG
ncbi:GAF domain-containing protein [Dactylosporangium sp. NPDC049140]|uniref:GAF domain-containing sensor histidine kinase n=1 Tax=Dactylosporangium sp. NPDC049140 TaxID=3155647 RepID=UPI0033D2C072